MGDVAARWHQPLLHPRSRRAQPGDPPAVDAVARAGWRHDGGRSGQMLQTARRRLKDCRNVQIRRGELESLPILDATLDAATLLLVLHHLPDPAAVMAEAARVLKPGGRLLVCDMLPHDHEEYRQQMGHVWLGFSDEQ